MKKVWVTNRFVDIDKARVSVLDMGFSYGDGVFETMRSYAGVVFKLDEHLKRLYTSMRLLGIRPPYDRERLESVIYRSLKVNRLTNAYIKVAVTRGEGRFGIGYKDRFASNTVVIAKDFEGYPAWMFERGINAEIAGIPQNEQSILSGVKSLNYLPNILARFEAQRHGFDDAILMNTKGHIAEAATSNVFLVRRGTIVTPWLASGILPGITRSTVIAIARKAGLGVRERAVTPGELRTADEIFLTNSLAEILPVTRFDRSKVGSGKPGEITKLLHICYQKEVIRTIVK